MKNTKTYSSVRQFMILFILGIFLTGNMLQVSAQKVKETKKVETTTKKKVKPIDKAKPVTNTKIIDDKAKTKPAVTTTAKPVDKTPKEQTVQTTQEPTYEPIVENLPKGKIDWTEQYVESKGMSVIDNEKFKNPAQAKLMARRGAIVDAQRNLLEIIKGVRVVSETKVVDMITESDYILSQVDGVIKNAQIIGEPVEKDGYIEVTMRVPLYDKGGVAPAIYKNLEQKSKKATMGKTTIPFETGNSEEIKTEDITDMVFNFNGKEYSPSMFPIIMDENNNILLDYSKYFDPKTGKFPKIVSASKDIINTIGSKKGAQIIDVLESFDGTIKIDNSKIAKKINWQKIGKVATTVGKIAMSLIL